MSLVCVDNEKNLGVTKCDQMPEYIKGMIETEENFSLTTVEAADSANWQDLLKAAKGARGYLWPDFFATTDQADPTVYEKTVLGKAAVLPGFYSWKIAISKNLCLHKAMYTHKRTSGRVFLIDTKNQIIGTTLADGSFAGLKIQLLNPEKMLWNTGTAVAKSQVDLTLQDNTEFDLNGAILDGSSFLTSLARLTDVTIAQTLPHSASAVHVTVLATCDGTPIIGLVEADFVLTTTGGSAQTITSLDDNGDGSYILHGSSLVAGFVDLVAASALSIDAYESTGKVAIVVS